MSSSPFPVAGAPSRQRASRAFPPRALQLGLWPFYLALIAVAMLWADANQLRDPVRGALALGSILVIAVFERWMPLDPDQRLAREPATLHDLGHMAANAATGALSGFVGIGSGWLIIHYVESGAELLAIWPTELHWLGQCMLALVAADFLGYWVHRAEHHFAGLWSYHVVHHAIERLHILRGTREHFVTSLVRGLLIYAPLVVLGAPFEALFAYQTLAITQGSIAHGNLALKIPELIHRWVVTPPVHRIHHASRRELSDSNFATITPVWDRLFGTWTDPLAQPAPEIGVEGDYVPDSLVGQLALPFRRWLALVR